MRLALLSGANPQIAREDAKVRLAKGSWKIEYEGVRDSVLWITLTSKPFVRDDEDQVVPVQISDGYIVNLEVPATAWLLFQHRGTERFISVFAQKVA